MVFIIKQFNIMKRTYKNNVRIMNESRDYFKSLLKEQTANINVFYCPCSMWDGTNCNSPQGHQVHVDGVSGAGLSAGDVISVLNPNQPNSGVSLSSQQDPFVVLSTSPSTNPMAGYEVIPNPDGCPYVPCDLVTFQNTMTPHLQTAPQQFIQQLVNNWIPMFHGKYFNHPRACEFLNKRLQINQDNLAQKQAAGTHPQWQAMLTAKIAAIQAIIAECC
jgi:hypothetical protein|tara:strand:- start:54 stop:707 length:654 start_codon:yes stop_codon:yes gene_type:complete